jgi:hypothetical protein
MGFESIGKMMSKPYRLVPIINVSSAPGVILLTEVIENAHRI